MEGSYQALESAAYFVMQSTLAVSILMIIFVVIANRILTLKDDKSSRVRRKWRSLIYTYVFTEPQGNSLFSIKPSELPDIARVWNHYSRTLPKNHRQRMAQLSRLTTLDRYAERALFDKKDRIKADAVEIIGYANIAGYQDVLIELLDSKNTVLSVKAAFALARTEGATSVHFITERMLNREDWAIPVMDSLIDELGNYPLCDALMSCVRQSSTRMARAIRLAPKISAKCENRILEYALEMFKYNDEVLSAVLEQAKTTDYAPIARRSLRHNTWFVRAKAADCLGRVGKFVDIDNLLNSLSDSEWWVRYRAAHSIIELVNADKSVLKKVLQKTNDSFAHDILNEAYFTRIKGI